MRDVSWHPPRSHFRCLKWDPLNTTQHPHAIKPLCRPDVWVNTSSAHCSVCENSELTHNAFIKQWQCILSAAKVYDWLIILYRCHRCHRSMLPPTPTFIISLPCPPTMHHITGSAGFMPVTPATIRSSPTCVFNDQISPWIIARLYSVKIGVRHPRHRPCITAPLKLQLCCYLLQKLSSAIHYQWTPIQM